MEIPVQIKGHTFIDKTVDTLHRDFCIQKGEIYSVRVHTMPVSIQCLEGVLWITKEDDRQDYVLQRCQTAGFEDDGHIVIQSFSQAKFRIESH